MANTSAASAPVSLTDPATLSQAFQAAWDRSPPAVSPTPEESGGGHFTYDQGQLFPLGSDRYAFVSEGAGEEGHVSPGAIAVHYLTRTANGFRRADVDPLIYSGGTFGNPPDVALRTDLGANPILQAESGGTWQGYTCSGADLIELTSAGPVQRTDYVRLHYSSGGARGDEGEEMDGRIVRGASDGEFQVQYSGATDATVTWRRGADGGFKPVNEPDLPWC